MSKDGEDQLRSQGLSSYHHLRPCGRGQEKINTDYKRQSWKTQGAFHSTKISENSGSKSNGAEISGYQFRKFWFTSRGCHFFWKFGNSRNFRTVPFGISTRFESAPVPLVVKSYKMAASLSSRHYTGCKIISHSPRLFLIENETLGSDCLKNCRLVVPNFLWFSSPGLHTLPQEKFVSFSHKYQGRVLNAF